MGIIAVDTMNGGKKKENHRESRTLHPCLHSTKYVTFLICHLLYTRFRNSPITFTVCSTGSWKLVKGLFWKSYYKQTISNQAVTQLKRRMLQL